MKTCKTCAWYCHSDGKCWGNKMNIGLEIYNPEGKCSDWTFDGLEDWEREPEETLVTMES